MGLKLHILCFFLCFGVFLNGQNTFETGIVHDSILVSGTNHETFALYLPKSYDKNQLNSIVFIFEPAARAAIGIKPFIKVSEKYGHILVCSNDSRNGPYERNFEIANRLFKDIFSRFTIEENEMYLSGFSGGSRLASSIASLTNRFAGVVGCGAGFAYIQEQMPGAHNYAYVGLCGDRDMNFKEMLENKDYLSLIKFNSTLITYNGEHRWPPQEQILRAFNWLHLQKLKKTTSNLEEIRHHYQTEYTLLEQFKEERALLFAAEQYERLLKDYKTYVITDSLAKQYQQLQKSKAYKKQVAALSNALKNETKLADKLLSRLTTDFATPDKVNLDWWKKELAKLDALHKEEDSEVQKMAFRVKFNLFANIYSRNNSLLYAQNEAHSKLVNQFMELLRSTSN